MGNIKALCCGIYRIAEKFGEFGESSVIRQNKTIQIFTYNYYLMTESTYVSIRQTFPRQMLITVKFAKLSRRQTFPLYGNRFLFQ